MSSSQETVLTEVRAMDSTVIWDLALFSRSPTVLFSFFQLLSMISRIPMIPTSSLASLTTGSVL